MAADLFRTRDHVPDFDRYLHEFAERSTDARRRHLHRLDVPFAPGPADRLDLFLPPQTDQLAPVHLFIHGGYWRMFAKSDYSFIADTVVPAGAILAVMDYSLMPAVRMETIVRQVEAALLWLRANSASFGGDPARLTASGHSAGAHLCALLYRDGSPAVPDAALLLSGIYDLAPLRSSFLQPEIGLTDAEVASFSPLRQSFGASHEIDVLVGERETAPFHQQAEAMVEKLTEAGNTAHLSVLPAGNHMSVVLDLGDPATDAGSALTALIRRT